jgi:NDP-sugar pyrophosphorylase family protein
VILAGGRGTRLAPYTTVLPKPLMPITDVPILEIVIRQLQAVGICNITLAVGYLASLLEAYFGDGSRWGVRIAYSYETKPCGTAGPLALVPKLTETFLVMNGDILATIDFDAMLRFHRRHGAMVTVGTFAKDVKIDLGIVETGPGHRIKGYIEKPTLNYDVSAGVYVMEPDVLQHIPHGKPFDLPDLVKTLIRLKRPVVGYPLTGHWLDIGRPEDYAQAVRLFEQDAAAFLPRRARG